MSCCEDEQACVMSKIKCECCSKCKGTGRVKETVMDPCQGGELEVILPCPKCQGAEFRG